MKPRGNGKIDILLIDDIVPNKMPRFRRAAKRRWHKTLRSRGKKEVAVQL